MSDTKGTIELPSIEIRAEPDKPSPDGRPGGSNGSGSNWSIGIGSGGGNGFFSGGFGGSSRKKAKKRAKRRKEAIARQKARAEAQAKAETEALALAQREAAHKQSIEALGQAYDLNKAELDQAYASKSSRLAQSLESEILAARKPPNSPGNERWQLYLISKEKSELEGLIGQKNAQLNVKNSQANSFNGHNPLSQGLNDYKDGLAQQSSADPALTQVAHSKWEQAYAAAHEAKMLSESIQTLESKLRALSANHAEQEIKWRTIDALHEERRVYAERRIEQIRHKIRVDEASRRDLIKAANTLHAPSASMAAGALVWGRGGALVAEGAAVALENSITAALKELGRIAAIRAGQTLSVSLSALLYSAPVGNGELTPEQRRRLFQGVSVGANAVGLSSKVDLPAVGRVGGSVELPVRIKAVPVERGTELQGVTTGGVVSASVPVINAVFDPVSDAYHAQTRGPRPEYVVVEASTALGTSARVAATGLYKSEPQISAIPAGVDTRIKDCIVCFPAESGLAPQYFSFQDTAPAMGFVDGAGQAASADWWAKATQEQGVAIPAQVGDQYRYREFGSVEAFDRATWRAIADDGVLSKQFDEVNQKRMANGFAPYAPKSSWVGERREFEFRNSQAANDAGIYFSLDQLSITQPNSNYGVQRLTPTFLPWPVSKGGTWTPLVPPGIETLGPTELPVAPEQPTLYPGETINPVGSQTESLPAVDPDDVNASIPGFGEDGDDLPSPDLVFAKPVQPLEVGPYNGMAWRSNGDGLDIDHIVSRQALKMHILRIYPDMLDKRLKGHLARGPSIAIPNEVHRRFSETYKGRNTKEKQVQDAKDLRAAVNSNFDAIKAGLMEMGFEDVQLEKAREELHDLNKEQGWYE